MTKEQRKRKLKSDIKSAENLRNQFATETPELDFYIETKREQLRDL